MSRRAKRGHLAQSRPGAEQDRRRRFLFGGMVERLRLRAIRSHLQGAGRQAVRGLDEAVVGAYGHVLGGAVGDEVDRFDIALGSPEHAYVLGTSTGLGNEYQLVIEDMILSLPDQGGAQRPDQVKADMVLFPIEGGGWVFSVGSITYGGALAWNGCDNDLSRLTANVLRAFAGKAPVLG
jgi:N,N-dimethylformamidase